MTAKRFLSGSMTILLILIAVESVDAQPIQFQASGSFISGGGGSDTNGDGVAADLFITSGRSSRVGPFTNQTVIEWSYAAPTTCPVGTVLQGTLVPSGSGFVSRSNNGDLLVGSFTSGTLCFDGVATLHITADANYTGGTGRFAGATGSFTASAIGTLVAAGFGSVVAEGSGTLTVP